MFDLIEKYLFAIPRAPDAGAGGGGGAAAGAPSGDGGDPAAAGGGAAPGSAAPAATPPQAYFPEGLPDNWRGKDERETIDRLFSVAKGYRDRDANLDRPEKPEGYFSLDGMAADAFKLDDRFKAHFDAFGSDPGMKAAAIIAQKHGIARPAFLEAVQASMSALSDAGMLEPMMDPAAERAQLLPDAARGLPKDQQDAAIDKRMTDNFAFVDLMVQNRGLPKEAGDYMQMMLGDSAKGHLAMEWMRNTFQTGGGQGGPGAHGAGGSAGDTADSLRAEMAKPELIPGHPNFDRAKYADFESRYKAFHSKG